jgi:hypothetical protein
VCTGSALGRSANDAVWRSPWVTTLK